MKQKKRLEALQSLTRDEPETCRPWILRLRLKKLLNKITWLDSWRSTSRTWPSHVGERVSKQNCVLVLITHRKQCVGVKKSRWRLLRTILRRRGQFFDIHFQTSRCLMQRSLPPWRRSSEMRTSKKGLSGRAEDSKKWPIPLRKTDRFYDLRTFPGNWQSCGSSRLLWSIRKNFTWRRRSRIWYQMGRSFIINPTGTLGRFSGKLEKMRKRGSDQIKTVLA